MKLPTAHGHIECREIVAYRIQRDDFQVRYDCEARGNKYTVFPETAIAAVSASRVAHLKAELARVRVECGEKLALMVLADACDLSEAEAPDMPHGFTNPGWVQ